MTIVSDEAVFNDASSQGDWTAQDFDSPTDNDTNSSPSIYREGTICQQWILKENITGGYTYTSTLGGTKDITGGGVVIFWFFITADADLDKLTEFDLQLSSDTGFTTNNARWDASQQIYDLDYYGWYPVAVYPSNPDHVTGTIVYSSIDSIGWYASTGAAGTKLSGFDNSHYISYLGGHSQTVLTSQLYDQSITDDLGVVLKFGDFYKFLVNIRLGGGTSTTYAPSNEVILFDNLQTDHEMGFIFASDSGTNAFTPTSCSYSWNSQPSTAEIFDTASNADTFKVTGCSFARGGKITLPADSANRWVRSTKFTDCQAGTASNGEFTDNIVDSGEAFTVSGDADFTGSQFLTPVVAADAAGLIWNGNFDPDGNLDDMTFSKGTNAHHAIEFGISTPTTMTLRGIDFSGFSGTDAQNDSTLHVKRTTGTVTINLVDCTGSISYKTAGATVVLVVSPVTITVNVKNQAGTNLQNARVLVETAATIASGEIYQAAVTSITQTAGTATVTTTAVHGLETNDYVVIRGAQPDEYNKVAQITVSSTTVFTYTVPSGISSPATGTPVVSYVAISGLTDASGNASITRSWAAAQSMTGKARLKSTTSPFYKDGDINFTVNTTAGNTINTVLLLDE